MANPMNTLIRILLAVAAVALAGCASTRANNPSDPMESYNRGMYQFNEAVDKAVIKPVAQVYDAAMPQIGKTGVSNFFSNLDDVIVTANDFLQLKILQGILDGTRFVVNTTVGIYGLIDIGSHVGLEKHNEDFGQTLGKWGVGNGPYIVLPILGPSTLRDSVGLYADSRPDKLRRVEHMRTRNQLYAAKTISRRAALLDREEILDEAAIDRYELLRDSYLLRRKSLVYDGNPPREHDEGENGSSSVQEPGSRSSQLDGDAPTAQPAASGAATIQQVSTATPQQEYDSDRPSVHRIWVAQRSGFR